jgi:tRNA dimethylallyltransferase
MAGRLKRNDPILEGPTTDILKRLREVDPVIADRWHPNDRRKIQRSLEIYLETGRRASDIYEEQSKRRKSCSKVASDSEDNQYLSDNDGVVGLGCSDDPEAAASESAPGVRFQPLVFWIHADHEILKPRLDNRVDQMIRQGLLSEVQSLQNYLKTQERQGKLVDQTRGIWVSIGCKEFSPYLTAIASGKTSVKELESLEQEAVSQTKAATRQYAKRQVRWIRIKLTNAISAAGMTETTFSLDGNDLARWSHNISTPALTIAKAFLAGDTLPDPAQVSPTTQKVLTPKRGYDLSDRRDLWVKRTCDVCGKVAVTEWDWEMHVKSRGHKSAVRKGKRAARPVVDEKA